MSKKRKQRRAEAAAAKASARGDSIAFAVQAAAVEKEAPADTAANDNKPEPVVKAVEPVKAVPANDNKPEPVVKAVEPVKAEPVKAESVKAEPVKAMAPHPKPLSKEQKAANKAAAKKRRAAAIEAKQAVETAMKPEEKPAAKPPTKTPTGECVYHSDYDGQSLPPPTKKAADSAVAFMEQETRNGNAPNEEEHKVDPALADGRTMTEHGKEADAAEQPVETPVAEPAGDAVVDTPAEQPVETPVAEPAGDPVVDAVKEEPIAFGVKPEPEKKPTLTLASNTAEIVAHAEGARKLYGSAFTAERSSKLADAFKWLEKAIVFEKAGEKSKAEMAFKAALKHEAAAFEIPLAKAA